MADNNQKFKATVKVTHQTETTLKNKPVRKEFDNPYRTSNYSSTRNFDKKDIARQASKDALNKKYERRPDRNNIQEIKDNSINRSNDNTSSVLNTFLNKRKSPYRDSGNVEDVNKKPAYEEEKVNKDKSEQNTQNNNEQANNEKTQENNNPASSKPSDLQPKDELEKPEKKGIKNRLGDLRNNLLNRNKNKAKKAAKGEVKKKALAFFMKNPYVLLFTSALVIILLIILIVIGGGSMTGSSYGPEYAYEDGGYWWPIGSSEITMVNGVEMASGSPVASVITSGKGNRVLVAQIVENHGGIDIGVANAGYGNINIIAAESGTVKLAVDSSSCTSNNSLSHSCSTGYGNYVMIEHDDGNVTVYGHMHQGTIRVKTGDKVVKGQLLGKMGSSGRSNGPHLHFEVRVNGVPVNPLDYVDIDNPRPSSYEGSVNGFNALKTSLSKTEFVNALKKYNYNEAYDNNFKKNAELIYDTSVANNINPELVVVTAQAERSFKKCGSSYNFWGIGVSNDKGCSDGAQYSSLKEGIIGYAKFINSYATKGSTYYSMIVDTYNTRVKAKCAKGGYGMPNTIEGMQSIWSHIGSYWFNPGSSGKGGCHILKIFVDEGFMKEKYSQSYYNSKCPASRPCDDSSCPATNTCERSDYTKWQVEKKNKIRKEIFGL